MNSNPMILAQSVDETVTNILEPIVSFLEKVVFFAIPIGDTGLPIVIAWLLIGGIFCTLYLRVRPIGDAVQTYRVVRGMLAKKSDPGQMTSFQAFATELAGTVGLGNIAGVAVAITLGGPGATLWIIIAGLLGMSLKLAEATLGQMYREVKADGTINGGPMYYLKNGLADVGKPGLGKFLAAFYAIGMGIAAVGVANIFQSNQVAAHLIDITGGEESFFYGRNWIIGVILAVLTGIVIIGGVTSIARWTSRLVPVMAVLYTLSALIILAVNYTKVPEAIGLIFTGAFTPEGVAGGVIGVIIVGVQRALFSNVAGVGTAGLAHSFTKNRRPAEEGLVAAWEPFVDSVVICTMTALAIIISGEYLHEGADGVVLATNAFATVNNFFPIILSICIFLFAFSTLLSYTLYGQMCFGYFCKTEKGRKRLDFWYNIFWLIMIVVGSAVTLDLVVRFSDATIFLVAVPNILGIYLLAKPLKAEIQKYRDDVRQGKVEPHPEHEQVKMLPPKKVMDATPDSVRDGV